MEKKSKPMVGVGWSLILLIFVVLYLVTLSILSFLTARSQEKLAVKSAVSAQAYYTADSHAQSQLALIDEVLASSVSLSLAERQSLLEELDGLSVWTQEGALMGEYAVPLRDGRSLSVQLRFPQTSADGRYEILRYQLLPIEGMEVEDETYELLGA